MHNIIISLVQTVEMIQWKAANPDEEVEKIKVPLKASFISTFLLIFAILFIICLIEIAKLNIWWPLSLGMIAAMVILPLILIFTVKQKRVKKNAVLPPKNLQFHNETLAQEISQLAHSLQFPEDFHEDLVEEPEQSEHNAISNVPNAVEEFETSARMLGIGTELCELNPSNLTSEAQLECETVC